MLDRCADAEVVNALVNHPDVRPHVGAPELGELDLTEIVERPENIFLMGVHGGFALMWTAPDVYEIHTFILQDGRGMWAFRAARDMLHYIKTNGAMMVWTKVPPDKPNIEAFTRRSGLTSTGQTVETFGLPYSIYKKVF